MLNNRNHKVCFGIKDQKLLTYLTRTMDVPLSLNCSTDFTTGFLLPTGGER